MGEFEVRSGFESVQVLFYSGIVNTQELVGGSHHVDTVGLSLGALLVHELIDWIIGRRTSEDGAHYEEKRPAQSGRAAFGDTPAADFYLTRLVRRGIDARKGCQRLFRIEPSNIADFR